MLSCHNEDKSIVKSHYGVEMRRALERHKAGDAWVIPIILRPVDWKETPIGDLQVLPVNGKPVTAWRNRDEAFQNVARGITEVTKLLLETRTTEDLRARHSPPLDRENGAPYILLVDDDLFANRLAQFVLVKEGYEVETAGDPRIAIQMIKRREPNLLILNITMPYMNGFQLVEKLRSEGYNIPFIFLTARSSLEAILHGFDIGADDYITKPYHYRVLQVRVRALIRRLYGKAF
jgi:CheY-like chemotaxis protein